MNTRRNAKVKGENVELRLREIDKLFRDLEKDKSLPTFGEHFMTCLMFGTAERVNLKVMYPKTYLKLSRWLAEHNQSVLAAGRK